MIAWDKFYSKEQRLRDYLGSAFTHTELFEEIIKEKPSKILDVGVGTGITSIFLSHLGYDVSAIDDNVKVLSSANNLSVKLNGKVNYVLSDAFNLGKAFKSKEFDLAFSQGFFEHFDDKQICRLIDEQLKVAKVVLISVPSKFYMKRDFGNERLMSKEKWFSILKGGDFKVNLIKYYGFHLPSRGLLLGFFLKPVFVYKFILGTLLKERSHLLIKIRS